jgi:hypothetical protein
MKRLSPKTQAKRKRLEDEILKNNDHLEMIPVSTEEELISIFSEK